MAGWLYQVRWMKFALRWDFSHPPLFYEKWLFKENIMCRQRALLVDSKSHTTPNRTVLRWDQTGSDAPTIFASFLISYTIVGARRHQIRQVQNTLTHVNVLFSTKVHDRQQFTSLTVVRQYRRKLSTVGRMGHCWEPQMDRQQSSNWTWALKTVNPSASQPT